MPPKPLLKYILDIEQVIFEIENVQKICLNSCDQFINNFMADRTMERNLEIIGEAINKMYQINPSLQISSAKHIIGLRNIIVHAYDTVDPRLLWSIAETDIPVLKAEISKIKSQ
jgi:uncharacterized protein with HEPN domain